MAYLAIDLITQAYYLSQVVSRGLQTVSGEQISDGLFLLNNLLDFKNSDLREIPYYQEFIFNTVQGQEMYSIPGLLSVDTMTFNIGSVRYAMSEETRAGYFGQYRIDNVQSLPFQYRMERTLDGMDVFMYFIPSQVFVMKIWGKFGLTSVTLQQDMSLVYDLFFIEYLRYALAQYICSEWGATFPDQSAMKLAQLEKKIMDVSPPDLSLHNLNYFGNAPGLDWQVINLSGGWLPY
ncbi:MAG: hypothetical protein EPO02_12815 [Nitrospirae bacterium]|nr:MAG: hypothetical protein EPO02_12815 [Nitrospirota bacterium]